MSIPYPFKVIDDSELHDLMEEWEQRRCALGIPEPPTDLAAIDLGGSAPALTARGSRHSSQSGT